MKRKISLFAVFVLLLGLFAAPAAAAAGPVVSLRVEGMDKTLYYNSTLAVKDTASATLRGVLDSYNDLAGVPVMTVSAGGNARVTAVADLKENSRGSDAWMILLNGESVSEGLDTTMVKAGDEIVVYYGDPSRIQYPEIDLRRMLSDGVVKFTSRDLTQGNTEGSALPQVPVAGATVVWDSMEYQTDASGEIIIDSTGAGIPHTVSIERYDESGLPTVLRFAPGYSVKCYDDVTQGNWFYDAVTFVSDKQMMKGVTEASFAPGAPVDKAMFITVLGRMEGADVDQAAQTGFADVVSDGWSAGYIKWALGNGLAAGNGDGTFGQYQVISREQLAVLLYRFAGLLGYDTDVDGKDLSAFADGGAVTAYAVPAMTWAVANGLVTGAPGRLDPQGQATRAQAAVLLQRFITEFMP
ncbi:protein of unknown function [Sporobacter termitidis DSM 10068]|uniref:SLH domain-containing protein n=1 Tax=Sporobacter termitidis DSM 10068 TaxID=1123282 RepID=A0A1M5WCA1_9FIRM|nr:S-layer homology domain-containing protein [Sporobacter termitidis]SHH85135.1 protein of unknown function [Sporobacter termitidis DSM 10068]